MCGSLLLLAVCGACWPAAAGVTRAAPRAAKLVCRASSQQQKQQQQSSNGLLQKAAAFAAAGVIALSG
jgi:hypothetical protein